MSSINMAESGMKNNEIIIPFGWKRSIIDPLTCSTRVTYVSPSGTVLFSIAEVCQYLENNATCKCGLQCPIRVPKVFNFNPQVQGKTMTKNEWRQADKPSSKKKMCLHWKKLHNKYLAKKTKSSSQGSSEPPPKLIIIRKGGQLTSVISDKKKAGSSDTCKSSRNSKAINRLAKTPVLATAGKEIVQDNAVSTSAVSPLKSPLFESASTSRMASANNDGKSKSDFKLQWIKADDESSHNDTESGSELCFSPDFKTSPQASFPPFMSNITSPIHSHPKVNQFGLGFAGVKNVSRPLFSPPPVSTTMAMGVGPVHRFGMSAFPDTVFVMKNEPGFDGNIAGCRFPGSRPPAYPQTMMKSEQDMQMNQASPYPLPTASSQLLQSRKNIRQDARMQISQCSTQWSQGNMLNMQTGYGKSHPGIWKGQGGNFPQGNIVGSPPGPRGQMPPSPLTRPGTPQHFPMGSPPPCNPTSPYPPSGSTGQGMVGASPNHRAAPSPYSNRSHSRSSSMGTPTPSPVPVGQWPRQGFPGDSSRPHSRSSNVTTPRPPTSPASMQQWNSLVHQGSGFPVRTPMNMKNMDPSQATMSPFSPSRQRFPQTAGFPLGGQGPVQQPHGQIVQQMQQQHQPQQQMFSPNDSSNMQVHFKQQFLMNQQMGTGANTHPNMPRMHSSQPLPVSNVPSGVNSGMFQQRFQHTSRKDFNPVQDANLRARMSSTFTFPTLDNSGRMPRMQCHQQRMPMQVNWATFHPNQVPPHSMTPGHFLPNQAPMLNRPPRMAGVGNAKLPRNVAVRPRMTATTRPTTKTKRTRRKSSKTVTTASKVQQFPTLPSNFMSTEFPGLFGQNQCANAMIRPQGPGGVQQAACSGIVSFLQGSKQYVIGPGKESSALLPMPSSLDIETPLATSPGLIIPPELDLPHTSSYADCEMKKGPYEMSPVISPVAPDLLSPQPDATESEEMSNKTGTNVTDSSDIQSRTDAKVSESNNRATESGVITPPLPLVSPTLAFESDEDDFSDFASPAANAFDFTNSPFSPNIITESNTTSTSGDTMMVTSVNRVTSSVAIIKPIVINCTVNTNADSSNHMSNSVSGSLMHMKDKQHSHLTTAVKMSIPPFTDQTVSTSISPCPVSTTFSNVTKNSFLKSPFALAPCSNLSTANTSLVSSSGKVFHVPRHFNQKVDSPRRYSANSASTPQSSQVKVHSESRKRYSSDPYPDVGGKKRAVSDTMPWPNFDNSVEQRQKPNLGLDKTITVKETVSAQSVSSSAVSSICSSKAISVSASEHVTATTTCSVKGPVKSDTSNHSRVPVVSSSINNDSLHTGKNETTQFINCSALTTCACNSRFATTKEEEFRETSENMIGPGTSSSEVDIEEKSVSPDEVSSTVDKEHSETIHGKSCDVTSEILDRVEDGSNDNVIPSDATGSALTEISVTSSDTSSFTSHTVFIPAKEMESPIVVQSASSLSLLPSNKNNPCEERQTHEGIFTEKSETSPETCETNVNTSIYSDPALKLIGEEEVSEIRSIERKCPASVEVESSSKESEDVKVDIDKGESDPLLSSPHTTPVSIVTESSDTIPPVDSRVMEVPESSSLNENLDDISNSIAISSIPNKVTSPLPEEKPVKIVPQDVSPETDNDLNTCQNANLPITDTHGMKESILPNISEHNSCQIPTTSAAKNPPCTATSVSDSLTADINPITAVSSNNTNLTTTTSEVSDKKSTDTAATGTVPSSTNVPDKDKTEVLDDESVQNSVSKTCLNSVILEDESIANEELKNPISPHHSTATLLTAKTDSTNSDVANAMDMVHASEDSKHIFQSESNSTNKCDSETDPCLPSARAEVQKEGKSIEKKEELQNTDSSDSETLNKLTSSCDSAKPEPCDSPAEKSTTAKDDSVIFHNNGNLLSVASQSTENMMSQSSEENSTSKEDPEVEVSTVRDELVNQINASESKDESTVDTVSLDITNTDDQSNHVTELNETGNPDVSKGSQEQSSNVENVKSVEKIDQSSSIEKKNTHETVQGGTETNGDQVPNITSAATRLGLPQDLTDTVIRQLSNYNTILKNLLVSGVGPVNPTILAQLGSNPGNLNDQQIKMLSAIINPVQLNLMPSTASVPPAMLLFQDSVFPTNPVLSGAASGSGVGVSAGQHVEGHTEEKQSGSSVQQQRIATRSTSSNGSEHAQSSEIQVNTSHPLPQRDSSFNSGRSQSDEVMSMLATLADGPVTRNVTQALSVGIDSPQVPSTSDTTDQDVTDGRRKSPEETPVTHQGLQVPIVSSSVKGTHGGETEDGNPEGYSSGVVEERGLAKTPVVQDEVSTSQPIQEDKPSAEEISLPDSLPEKEQTPKNIPESGRSTPEKRRGRLRNSSAQQKQKRVSAAATSEKTAKRSVAASSSLSNLRHRTAAPVEKPPKPQVKVGDLVWGQMRGFPSWPGKIVRPTEVRGIQQRAPLPDGKVWVKWFGDHTFTQMNPMELRSMTEGLEAHHRSRKKGRTRNRKISIHLETAIQEAVDELEQQQESKQASGGKKFSSSNPTASASSQQSAISNTPETSRPRGRSRKRKAT